MCVYSPDRSPLTTPTPVSSSFSRVNFARFLPREDCAVVVARRSDWPVIPLLSRLCLPDTLFDYSLPTI